MATSPRGLAFVLTMAAWVPASIHTGSLHSGWWGTKEALQLRQAAAVSISEGHFDDAEQLYRSGVELGARHHDPLAQAWFLDGEGSASLAGFRFRRALDSYIQAKSWAEKARDRTALGAIEGDLASLYQQMGDFDSALHAAERARAVAPSNAYYRPQVLFLLGQLYGGSASIPLLTEGIEAAGKLGSADRRHVLEAYGWDLLCQARIESGDLNGANAAEQKALALRAASDARDLGYSDWLLGAVRLRQAEQIHHASEPQRLQRARLLHDAEDFTRKAAFEMRQPPAYHLAYQRGRVLLAEDRIPEALTALEDAVVQAQRWRLGLVPTLGAVHGASANLQTRIFDGFIETAADYGWRTGQTRWIEESLEAAELNRAVNLHDNAQSPPVLSPEYHELLAQLQAEETRLSQTQSASSALADRLRLKLTDLESEAGLGFSSNMAENFPSHASLIHLQENLSDSEILLSFALEEPESFLWAVTRSSLNVYRLPPKSEIVGTVREFRHGVEEQKSDAEALGEQLYQTLFGQLRAAERAKPAWQISAHSTLLEVPFAALVLQERSGQNVFLAQKHSLQVKAGALFSGNPQHVSIAPRGFVSVGDPIYNLADPRWRAGKFSWFPVAFRTPEGQLNRLPGTRREVELSAAAWQSGSQAGPSILLEGSTATRARFLQAISPAPAVIHLATHALGTSSGEDAFLVFSLGPDGRPEMLSTKEIRTLRVPGSVVVMTGCATAPSQVRPGLGLAGLVRAWTVAGASAVMATEWPVKDSAGSALLASFYKHLRGVLTSPGATQVAQALQLAQVERIGSDNPAAWAAYQVFSGRVGDGRNVP